MGQSVRQAARRAALDARSRRQRERAEREKRVEDLVVEVLVALGERDAVIAEAEQRAGQALTAMIEAEGLTTREAVEWCDGQVSAREVSRLRTCARRETSDGPQGSGGDGEQDAAERVSVGDSAPVGR